MTPAKRFAEMKDSGIEWVGMIPATWDVFPAGGVFDEVKEKNVNNQYSNPFSFRYGEIVDKKIAGEIDESVEETLSAYRVVSPNTIMINGLNLNYDFISQRVAIVREKGIITSAYLAVQPDEGRIVPRFVLYLLKAYDYRQVFHGVGSGIRKTLKFQDFKSIKIVAPSLTEQTAIAAYLDTQCAKIDEIIAQAKASIEDYKQWKASIIYEAVTKGLDPNVEMKDSGIEWIGRMPSDWAIIRVKNLLAEINDRSETGSEEPLSMSQVLGIVPSSMIAVANPATSYVGAKIVRPNDLVFNKLKAHLGVFAVSNYDGLVSPDYAVYRANERANPKFLEYLFKTPNCIQEFKKYITGVGAGLSRLYTSDLFNIKVALPVIDVQKHIVEYLNDFCSQADALIDEKQSLIDDLESYKKSLIYEVVTGKRRV